jgi:thiamine biosynthesis lipoprotein
MGTLFEALLVGDDEEQLAAVAEAVLDEVERIDRLLSRFNPTSEIYRINRLAGRQDVLVDREVADLLALCQNAFARTRGAFDITATSQASGRRQPPGDVVYGVVDHTQVVEFDIERRLARFKSREVRLDLGGIGKGYALDRAAHILADHGIHRALLHGGTSSAIALGSDERGQPWRVACGKQLIELVNRALSCSATNEQQDIIDPRSGKAVQGKVLCAVIADTATEAEIWSTTAVVMGRETADRLTAGLNLHMLWNDEAST